MQVCAHVMRLGRRRIVHIAADVAVEVFGFNLFDRYQPGIAFDVLPLAIHMDDLGDIFGTEKVLRLALAIFPIRIDEEDVLALSRTLLVHHQYAGGNACAVEQPGRQSNDGFEPATLDEVFPRLSFFATSKQHPVRHDGGHFPVGLQHGQHMLDEHEIGLLALLRHPDGKAARVLDVLLDVVLTEGRIGEDAVVALQFVVLVLVLGTADRILLTDIGVRDAVQEHVHLADGPSGADALLSKEREIPRISATLPDVVARLNEHPSGAAGRVVHTHARLGIDDLDKSADDISRRIKLSRFLSRRVGEKLDQILIGRAEQVGKLEVFIAQRDLLEILDEVGQRVVVQRPLADLAVEVDVFEHVLKRFDIGVFQSLKRLIQSRADIGLEVANLRPMSDLRNKEGVFVRVDELRGDLLLRHPARLEALGQLLALLIEQIAHPFQEEHAEDVFLVLGRIHVPAQIVARAEQEARQLAKGEFGHPAAKSNEFTQLGQREYLAPALPVERGTRLTPP